MEVIRKGNDLEILWNIYTGEGEERIPYDLTGRDVSFFLVSAYGRQRKEDIVTEGNVLRWMFRGKDQKESVYSLELVINDGQDGMRSVDICDAFRLVGKCCDVHSHPTEGVELQYMQFSSTWGTEYIEVVDRLDSDNSNAALSARQGKVLAERLDSEGVYAPDVQGSTVQDFGDIKAGTTVGDLRGRTYDQMFDAILFPTVNPTFAGPSVSLALDGATLREVGAAAPSLADFAVTFSRGAINLLGSQQAYRSGAQNLASSFLYIGGDAASKALPSSVALGETRYNYRAYYAAGPQPYDNKGKAYGLPLPAGYVDSNAVTVYGTLPWYATTAGSTGGNPVKQALVRWGAAAGSMATPEFTLLPTDTCAQVISVPREITELYIKDETSGNFIQSDLTSFQMKQENRIINGISQPYYTYTYTGSGRGSITLKIKF